MKLATQFIKLPYRFDIERMKQELAGVAENEWEPHPQGFAGNSALPLVAAGGDPKNNDVRGPMRPTPVLARLPYIRQIFATFESTIGRSRLMRLGPQAEANAHYDRNYYWHTHTRIHVPIVTHPEISFVCAEKSLHMAEGECWIFDTWKRHNVLNPTATTRVHLVVDTVGSGAFWKVVAQSERPFAERPRLLMPPRLVVFEGVAPNEEQRRPQIDFESYNFPSVMSPLEIRGIERLLQEEMADSLECPPEAVKSVGELFAGLVRGWETLWRQYGREETGWAEYASLLEGFKAKVAALRPEWTLPNGATIVSFLQDTVGAAALNTYLAALYAAAGAAEPAVVASPVAALATSVAAGPPNPGEPEPSAAPGIGTAPGAAFSFVPSSTDAGSAVQSSAVQSSAVQSSGSTPALAAAAGRRPGAGAPAARPAPGSAQRPGPRQARRRFVRPVCIVAAPRSGSTLLFETLAQSPDFHTVGGESHEIFEGIPALTPAAHDWSSNRLEAIDATPAVCQRLQLAFLRRLHDRAGRPVRADQQVRLLEKTPKNALRIPFLNAVFPDALFVYLLREPPGNLGSIVDAWESGKFVTYRDLPGRESGQPWSLLLTPGWRELSGKGLAQVAASQWRHSHEAMLADLEALPAERWTAVDYDRFVANPQREIEHVCTFLGVRWNRKLEGVLPPSRFTLSPPDPEKWRRHEAEIAPLLPELEELAARARQVVAKKEEDSRNFAARAAELAREAKAAPPSAADLPLRSVHTASVTSILQQIKSSIAVSTYQAGKFVLVRSQGESTNTHFRGFNKPMGVAFDRGRLAIGSPGVIHDYRNVPAAGQRVEAEGEHDACFVPRRVHTTGDIDIHEMAWAGPELWFVNTRFSCLCTLDADHSFVPRWRPSFVSAYSPEDRCHLNGLAIKDGKPKWVTALGDTDSHNGWRENKAAGGVLIDVDTQEIVCRGLSMPHSPRWYRNRLYVLESGKGTLATVDPATGEVATVVELPGFTRGLSFFGPLAFVGLSQVRETAVFAGLPITERVAERYCGVWIINLETAAIFGFIRFEDAVQEVFAVEVLPGLTFPELLAPGDPLIGSTYVLPDQALAEVKLPGRRSGPALAN